MARGINNVGIPLDEPILERPGVIHKENGYSGNAANIALPPEHPERAEKGDLGLTNIPDFEPKPLSHGGLPFDIKR